MRQLNDNTKSDWVILFLRGASPKRRIGGRFGVSPRILKNRYLFFEI